MSRRDLTCETAADKVDVAAEARRRGIEPYQVRAIGAVDDRLMADIVSDARRGIPQTTSLIPDRQRSEEKPRPPSGGTVPLQPPPGIEHIDRMVAHQDRIDRAAAIRVRIETELAEAALRDRISNRVQSDYNPYSRKRMGFSDDD